MQTVVHYDGSLTLSIYHRFGTAVRYIRRNINGLHGGYHNRSRVRTSPEHTENKRRSTSGTPPDFRRRATVKSGQMRRVYRYGTRPLPKLFENPIYKPKTKTPVQNWLRLLSSRYRHRPGRPA
jgi:hypothetical protein